jgi:2-polyprenyl-3-methyl-5-hydroxy-6-metoxy-1,4-benzoquinol methylase
MAEQGRNVHGEADLVESLLRETGGTRVLDAGCGTGRVAIELARRGHVTSGVDVDAAMLDAARSKSPELSWVQADLAELDGTRLGTYDVIVMAGNVMIFLERGTEQRVISGLTALLAPGGLVVSGFQVLEHRLTLHRYDELCASVGLELVYRWGAWDRTNYSGGDYAVSTHRAAVSGRMVRPSRART